MKKQVTGAGNAATGRAIEARNLVKTYKGSVRALDGLSFSVDQNTTYALLGPNGAGKTTTISILTTLALPSQGTAFINGMNVVRDQKNVRREIGVTFQEMVLDDALTGRQVLIHHGRLYRLSPAVCRRRSEELLELVELNDSADRKCKTYSGGMKRRLELARALVTVPSVLFLDEPTLGLDPQGRSRIWEYIKSLMNTSDLTVFLTTHYLDEAYQLADRVGIMDRGRLVAEGSPDKLIDELGADTVTIRGTGQRDALGERFRTMDFVQSVSLVEDGILLGVQSSSRRLAQIVSVISELEFTIDDVSVAKPDLGAVFFKYTGHKLRDGEDS